MRKIIICLFVLILFSCSNDDDKIENPIDNPSFSVDLLINRWKYDQVNINGQQYLYGHQPNCQKDEFTFANNQGQIRQYSELTFVNDICSTNSTIMEWKIKNDIISLYFGIEKVIDFKVFDRWGNGIFERQNYTLNRGDIIWDGLSQDRQLNALHELLSEKHNREKVLVFTQFADTAYYLTEQLKKRGVTQIESVTGADENPTAMAKPMGRRSLMESSFSWICAANSISSRS